MSDYMYMLESHLSPDQNRVVEDVQAAAGSANVSVFLTGGAMRDMLAGFPIRDLDFVVEGNALKVAKAICERTGAKAVSTDESRKTTELVFSSGVTAQVAMSRQEKYPRSGGKPTISPATIQEDLRGRDFTCNGERFDLPGGWILTVPTHASWRPDGRRYIDQAVTPDIEVKWTLQDLCEGRDPDMSKALDLLGDGV